MFLLKEGKRGGRRCCILVEKNTTEGYDAVRILGGGVGRFMKAANLVLHYLF
jgi:hypothetical protein